MSGEVRSVRVVLSAQVTGYLAGMGKADAATAKVERGLERLNKKTLTADQTMGRIGKVGGRLFLGAAAGIAIAEKKAADFNSEMATVYTLSHANTRQQELLAKAAKSVGVNIGYSATESASAEEELIKAGVKLKDILGGGLKGALDLAAAGQTDVGTATEVAASAMTQFKLKGKDVPHIADLLAAGADKALGSVSDLGYGLSQTGTQAHQMGFSIEETVGTLAEFAQSGLIGEKGGSTLKQMFLQLAAPTEKAQKLMDKYGVSLYDANGQVKTMPELAGNLQRSFKNLDPASRNAALGIIFGSRAIQGANILIADGEKKNRKWIKSVDDQGFAAHQAAGKMDSLKGDLKKLNAVAGNVLIGAGGKQGFLRGMTQDATKLLKKYDALSDRTKGLFGKAFVGAAAVGGALWTANKVYKIAKSTAEVYAAVFKTNAAASLVDTVAGGGLGKKAGVVPVYVTNLSKVPLTPTTPTTPTAIPTAPGGGGGGGTPFVLPAGKKPPNWIDDWAAFQKGGGAGGLGSLGKLGLGGLIGVGGMVAFGGGTKSVGVGQQRGKNGPVNLGGAENLSAADIARLSDAQKKMLGLADATREQAQSQKFASAMWKTGYDLMGKINPEMGKYGKTVRSFPKQIRTYLSTPGARQSTGEMQRLAKQYHLTPKQIITSMKLQGYTDLQGRIVAAGRAFSSLPKQVKTALRADTVKSQADVKRLKRQYDLTPRQVQTVMHVSGVDQAIAKAHALRAAIAAVQSKSVTIDLITRRRNIGGGQFAAVAKADGGTVPGQRFPYGDKTLIAAAPGEEIITNRNGEADRFRRDRAAGRIPAYAGGGTVGGVSGGTGTRSVTVTFPAPKVYAAAVKAADDIAAAAVKTTATAKDLRAVHLDDLHQQQSIRDLQKSLNEHNKKTVGKGKNRHTVKTGFTLTGLDRKTAKSELADAKATLVEMRKQSDVAKALADARQEAREAQQQARTDAQSTITGGFDLLSRGPAGAAAYTDRYTADVAKFGNVIARLRGAKASPMLLQKMVDLANSGDFRTATRFGQSLLDQPALLTQLNTSLTAFGQVAGGVANLTTDPRFLSSAAWNPTSQVANVQQVQVLLAADPSTWMTQLVEKTAFVVQARLGAGGK